MCSHDLPSSADDRVTNRLFSVSILLYLGLQRDGIKMVEP